MTNSRQDQNEIIEEECYIAPNPSPDGNGWGEGNNSRWQTSRNRAVTVDCQQSEQIGLSLREKWFNLLDSPPPHRTARQGEGGRCRRGVWSLRVVPLGGPLRSVVLIMSNWSYYQLTTRAIHAVLSLCLEVILFSYRLTALSVSDLMIFSPARGRTINSFRIRLRWSTEESDVEEIDYFGRSRSGNWM